MIFILNSDDKITKDIFVRVYFFQKFFTETSVYHERWIITRLSLTSKVSQTQFQVISRKFPH